MNGRSIQDIVPPARSRPLRQPSVTPQPPVPPQPREPMEHMDMEPRRGNSMWLFVWIAVGALVVAILAIVLMSTVFHSATASVTLLEWRSDVSGTYQAGGDSTLTYTPVSVSDSVTRTVAATGSIDAKDHASGTIVVSNLYSAKEQRLITNTRFETADGKVYRIHAPITVPGYTTKNGEKIAGTLEAVVYADEPGEAYNTDSADFKLPGLKGSTQYDLITARTKGPLSGGFVGKRATVEQSVRDQAVVEMKAELDRKLRERVMTEAPAQSVVFADSIAVRYLEKPDRSDGDQATIEITGTAIAPAFAQTALSAELALRSSVSSDAPLELDNAPEVAFAAVDTAQVETGGSITFTLSGSAHLVAQFSPQKLAADLAGKTQTEADSVRSSYPALIGPMTISVYPFWLSTLPENPERIDVEIKGALDQNN